jgi:hypothetical protein
LLAAVNNFSGLCEHPVRRTRAQITAHAEEYFIKFGTFTLIVGKAGQKLQSPSRITFEEKISGDCGRSGLSFSQMRYRLLIRCALGA